MTTYEAVDIAEGFVESSEEKEIEAWQLLIDTGAVWQLQGWFGRRAMALIREGICRPPKEGDIS